jgi:hypothetical protein
MSHVKSIPYSCVEEVKIYDGEVLVKLGSPVIMEEGVLVKREEVFTYSTQDEKPEVGVDPETFQVTLNFGKNKRLHRKLIKNFNNEHI